MKRIEVVLGVVRRAGQILICRRRQDNPDLPNYWEFPGGKVEPGESPEECLHRELREEVAVEVRATTLLPPIEYTYPHAHVTLHPYLCEWERGDPKPLGCDEPRWIALADLPRYTFPPANAALITALRVEQDSRRSGNSH
jgi:mutator protein MutT